MNNNIENIIKLLDINEITLWTVSKGNGDNNKIFDTSDQVSLEERKNKFREVMKLYKSGNLVLIGRRSKTDTRGLFKLEFDNLDETPAVNGIGNMQPQTIQGVPENKVQELINEALEKADTKRKLHEQESEIKTLKKELDEAGGTVTRVIGKLDPIIGLLVDRFLPKQTAVSLGTTQFIPENHSENNTEVIEEPETVDDATMARIQTAVEQWADADPDFLTVLEFLSKFAASGEKIMGMDYQTVKGMLLK